MTKTYIYGKDLYIMEKFAENTSVLYFSPVAHSADVIYNQLNRIGFFFLKED